MKWIYNVRKKSLTSLLLFIVLGLVMYTNYRERQNAMKINEAISTIYEDRLVVESYIFQYAEHLHHIIATMDDSGIETVAKQSLIANAMKYIRQLNTSYLDTKLTRDEELNFNRFTALCQDVETYSVSGQFAQGKTASKDALSILTRLSSIQVEEGRAQIMNAEKLFTSARVISQFEITVLIVIALLIQALLFAARTLQVKPFTQAHRLN